MFPVSEIDKPLCPVCVNQNLLLGSSINSIARKPVISRFELRTSRPLPHVCVLSGHAQFFSYYVNYICRYICQAAHTCRLVSHISEEWFVNESFYFISPSQKLAAKIKAFQSAFETKDLAANGTC